MIQETLSLREVGYVASAIATLLWGIHPLLISNVSWSSARISLVRNLAALLGSTPFVAASLGLLSVSIKDLLLLLLLGLVGPGLADQLYVYSMKRIGVSLSTAITYTYVFWASIIASIIHLEKLSIEVIIGMIISFTGFFIGIGSERSNNRSTFSFSSVFAALVSGFLWGVATVLSKLLVSHISYMSIVFFRSLSASFILYIIVRGVEHERVYARIVSRKLDLVKVTVSGLLSLFFAYIAFLMGLKSLGVAIPSMMSLFSPIITLILSTLLGRERIRANVVISVILIVLGLLIASLRNVFYAGGGI